MIPVGDPRPKNRKELIEKFRKVKPIPIPTLPPGSSSSHARRAGVLSGIELYTGAWEEPQVAQLLRRLLFGIKKSELDYFKTRSMEEVVDELLTPSPLPPPPVNDYNGIDAGVTDPTIPFGQPWVEAAYSNPYEGFRIISLKSWMIKNMINQQANIHEKMVFFWHNLLVTQTWDLFISKASYQYFTMLRRNALGNYKTLIKELTLDPAMLIYLNGTFNNKDAPDENYGRELQELFCVGKGPGSQYTEGDVQAAARVLTGWVVNWPTFETAGVGTSFFYPDFHDTTNKQFSSFYGNKVIQGKAGASGAEELDELLDMIFDAPETARYICRRLYSFFVYSEIDEATEENVIVPLADIFRSENFEILPVLQALFKSAHFHDELNRGAIIKSPLDHALGVWRTLGLQSPLPGNIQLDYVIHSNILWHMASLGLEVGDPPNVAGWPAYYQVPQFDKSWITTDTITTRAITTDSLIYWGFWVAPTLQIKADLIAFVSTLDDPANPTALLQDTARLVLGMDLSAAVVTDLKSILLSGQQQDYYWSDAWYNHVGNPTHEEYKLIVQTRLQAAFQRLLQLGEYQLM